MNAVRLKKILLRLLLISLSASAFAGIFVLLFGEFRETEVKILLTTLSIGGCSLTGLCSSVIYDTRHRLFSITGMIIAALCFILVLITIWVDAEFLLNNWKLLELLIILTVSFAHVSLILIQPSANKFVSYLKAASISCTSIVVFVLICLIWEIFEEDEYFFRVLGVFAILDVAGTISTVILNRIHKPD